MRGETRLRETFQVKAGDLNNGLVGGDERNRRKRLNTPWKVLIGWLN